MEKVKFVGRYDNGSGYMEWAGSPVATRKKAEAQIRGLESMGVDVIEVKWSEEYSQWLEVND